MRRQDIQSEEWFSYKILEELVLNNHSLCTLRLLKNNLLKSMDSEFEKLLSDIGRPSFPPEGLFGGLFSADVLYRTLRSAINEAVSILTRFSRVIRYFPKNWAFVALRL
jgi:hypothetical protein